MWGAQATVKKEDNTLTCPENLGGFIEGYKVSAEEFKMKPKKLGKKRPVEEAASASSGRKARRAGPACRKPPNMAKHLRTRMSAKTAP